MEQLCQTIPKKSLACISAQRAYSKLFTYQQEQFDLVELG